MGKSYARICEIIYYFSKHFIYKRKKNLRYLQIKLRLSPSALLRVNFIRAEISLGGGGRLGSDHSDKNQDTVVVQKQAIHADKRS